MLTIEYQCFISNLYARRFEILITLSIKSLLKTVLILRLLSPPVVQKSMSLKFSGHQ